MYQTVTRGLYKRISPRSLAQEGNLLRECYFNESVTSWKSLRKAVVIGIPPVTLRVRILSHIFVIFRDRP